MSTEVEIVNDLELPFKKLYNKVLEELDTLYRGVYDPSEAAQTAALCLLAQAALIRMQATAELNARGLKRDIDFAKAEVYFEIKKNADPGKKLTDKALDHLVNKNDRVHKLYQEQNQAEKEAKEWNNILSLLKDAHITFRSFAKKGE